MPIGGRPLSPKQVETLRRWIDEGATADTKTASQIQLKVVVKLPPRINVSVPDAAYLTIEILHPATGVFLWSGTASMKSPPGRNDAGHPGAKLHWDIRPAPGWPATVTAPGTIEHATSPLRNIEFNIIL